MDGASKAFWVGIDVSKAKFDVAVCAAGTMLKKSAVRRLRSASFASTREGVAEFLRWLGAREGVCKGLCAESTGVCSADLGALLAELAPELPPLVIANPRTVLHATKGIELRDKTDALDACVIAAWAAACEPDQRPPRDTAWQELRVLWRGREAAKGARTAAEARLRDCRSPLATKLLRRDVAAHTRIVERYDETIASLIASHPVMREHCRLLQSIPGIGPAVSEGLLAFYGDLTGWSRGELASAAGIHPVEQQSGTSLNKQPRIAKGGGAEIRRLLYMAAMQLLSRDYGFNGTALRMVAAGHARMAALFAAARKLLIVARAVVLSGQPYRRDYQPG